MGSKALLVLVMFLATILLISADFAPNDFDEKFDKNDGDLATNGVDQSKYGGYGGPWRGGYGGGYGGPWRGGYGGPWRGGGGYCPYGCCYQGYYGGCRRCCYYPGEHLDVGIDARPHN